MPKTFYVGVKGIIVNKAGQVLVLKKEDEVGKEFWDIPGGRIDSSETISEALKRELKEEITNIGDFEVEILLTAKRLERDLKDGNGLLLLYYKVKTDLEEVKISNEHKMHFWVDKNSFKDLDGLEGAYLTKGSKEAIKLVLG